MKTTITMGALLCCMGVFSSSTALPHGGQYRGPRDIVPPNARNRGEPPTTNGPNTPNLPPGPRGPSTPRGHQGPLTPPPSISGSKTGPTTPRGPSIDLTASMNAWDFWWEFNRERYLNLKRRISSVEPTTESDEYYFRIINKGGRDLIGISRDIVRREIHPLIREVLVDADRRQRDEISSALVALGKLGIEPDDSLSVMREFLRDKDQEISETAAISMGILADPSAIPLLAALLRDTERGRALLGRHQVSLRTQAFAAYGLGLIGYQLKGEAYDEARAKITEILAERLRVDTSASKDNKISCIISLGLIPNDEAAIVELVDNTLLPYLNDKKSRNINLIRAHIPTAMMRMARHIERDHAVPEQWAQHFLKMLGDRKEDYYVRQSLVLALGGLVKEGDTNYKQTLALLKKLQKDGRSKQERYFTGVVLGQIGGIEAIDFLLRQLNRGKTLYKPWAALGLGVYGYESNEAGGIAVDPRGDISGSLALALKRTKAPEYKGAFAIALGLLRDLDSSSLLIKEMLKARVQAYKGYLGVALGLMRSSDATDAIRAEIKKSLRRPEQLQQLSIGLGLLGDRGIVDELIEMMTKAHTTSVYAALAQALGFIGDARSVEPLVTMVRNRDLTGQSRAFAIVALGIVGDKEEYPWNTKISENMNYRASVTTLTGTAVGILDIL